jgi:hypothetical protein
VIARYYRFTAPAVLYAVRQYAAESQTLTQHAHALAEAFGGRPLYSHSLHGRSFHGLVFEPPQDHTVLWTKPDFKSGRIQRPRSTCPRAHRDALKDLRERWNALLPTFRPSLDPVWKACGTDWGALIFCGVGYLMRDDAFFVTTAATLTGGVEITGSDYAAAAMGTQS